MVGISSAVEWGRDLVVAPGDVLMAVTVVVAELKIVTSVIWRENFLVVTSIVVGMVDGAVYVLVKSDVSHVVVVVAVIAETGAVPDNPDAARVKAAKSWKCHLMWWL